METFLIYIGKSALAAGAFYLAYLALFQHQKHFLFNRIYLPVSLAVSFLIPLITFTSIRYIQPVQTEISNSFAYLPAATPVAEPEFVYQWYHYLFALYLLGAIAFCGNLIFGHLKVINIVRFSRLKEIFGVNVNISPLDVHPFSFFNRIVLSKKTLNDPNLDMIVSHELVHVSEKHTLDILFTELLFLLQWFNPFAWLIRDAVRSNLEYLTDDQITKQYNAETYQLAMVGLAHKKGVAPFLTALNGSQLKTRIIMMKKKTENRYSLLKQLVVLPLLAILVMGLSNKEVKTEFVQAEKEIQIVVDGVELPSNHSALESVDFSTKFDGEVVIEALGIKNKVVANTLALEDGSESGTYYIQTTDYKEGANPNFEYFVNGYRSTNDRFKTIQKVNNSNIVIGKIKDIYSNLPIQGASIQIDVLGLDVSSDKNGNYNMSFGKNKEPLVIQVSAEGYYDNKVMYYGTDSELDISLVPIENLSEKNTIEKVSKEKGKPNKTLYTVDGKILSEKEAKEITITGKVTNEKGEPIASSATLAKDTKTDIRANLSGNYEQKAGEKQDIGKVTLAVIPKEEGAAENDQYDRILNFDTGKTELVAKKYITGKVTDTDGNPVSGVSVSILNKSIGDKTDSEGNFKIATKNRDITLSAWADGYNEQQIEVNGREEVNIRLIAGINSDEVIVVGYGKLKAEDSTKVRVTGNGKMKDDTPVWVKAKLSGNAENQPLYFVDGKEVASIEHLDPESIESISVLKDKQAENLYGEKGKNGVILVTTKAIDKSQKQFDATDKIIIVDGKSFDGDLNDIDPNDISSINVQKNKVDNNSYDGNTPKKDKIIIQTKTKYNSPTPLIIVDGVKFEGDMNEIDPEDIESVSVLKDASAIDNFGEEAKDGVVLITTKSNSIKITSELELRKFIAQRIRYPLKPQEHNIEETVQLFVKIDNGGRLFPIPQENAAADVFLEDVVVVGYQTDKTQTSDILTGDFSKYFSTEVKRVVYQIPKLDMDQYKGKTIGITVKFKLQ